MLAEISWLTERLKRLIAPFLEWRRQFWNKHMSFEDGFNEAVLSARVEKAQDWLRSFWAKEANRDKVVIGVITGVVGAIVIKLLSWIFG
jgi:hypothetical protein